MINNGDAAAVNVNDAETSDWMVHLHSLASDYLDYYRFLITTYFPELGDKLVPGSTNGGVGFVGLLDVARRRLSGFGLFALQPGAKIINLLPEQDPYRAAMAYNCRVIMHVSSETGLFQKDLRASVWEDICSTLARVLVSEELHENKLMVQEWLLASMKKHFTESRSNASGHHYSTFPTTVADAKFAILLRCNANKLQHDLYRVKDEKGEFSEHRNGAFLGRAYEVTREEEMEVRKRAALNAAQELWPDEISEEPFILRARRAVEELERRGVNDLTSEPLFAWYVSSCRWDTDVLTFVPILRWCYESTFRSYRNFAKSNFPALFSEFSSLRQAERIILHLYKNPWGFQADYVRRRGEVSSVEFVESKADLIRIREEAQDAKKPVGWGSGPAMPDDFQRKDGLDTSYCYFRAMMYSRLRKDVQEIIPLLLEKEGVRTLVNASKFNWHV